MYSTIADLGTWAASGLGTSLLPADLAAKRLSFHDLSAEKISYGLGLEDYGNGWIGHSGQLIGWEAITLNNPETGAAFVAMVNETGSLVAAKAVAAQIWPELASLLR